MPTTATVLGQHERRVLHAVGCGLRDDEIAADLAIPEDAVAGHLAGILAKLGLRDRAAAIVHAFDCGLVVPGSGPRTGEAGRAPATAAARATAGGPARGAGPAPVYGPGPGPVPTVRISLLGPLQVRQDGRSLNLGHLRQQAVLAALALGAGRTVSRRELLDGIWGTEPPHANVVPVYVYRLRKALRTGGGPAPVIEHDRCGYRLAPGTFDVDVAHLERLLADVARADRAGEATEVVRLCTRALDLFRGEPLAGLPGPLAEAERLRLTERRIAVVQRKSQWQLRLGRHFEAIAELFALAAAQPLNETVAVMLMRALCRGGRRTEALAVFAHTRRRLAEDLGVRPSRTLRGTYEEILCGDHLPAAGLPVAGRW
ncbi:BTAD domain-containing putative transcriptional regulator [Streptomyces roseus]|uniref:BTAD domain-containing putative transcriptional regulator n=1 Tax=Streptomyces roseus TaxID=66430 RepID=UPI0036A95DB9